MASVESTAVELAADATEDGPLLTVRDLTVSYGPSRHRPGRRGNSSQVAVKNISFQLGQGETLALVGESGSGKSTVARATLGLLPAQGSVTFQGKEVLGQSRRRLGRIRRGMQMIFQDPSSSLDPRWTVEQILREAIPRKPTSNEIADLLTAVKLPTSCARKKPRELSGGQRQRVAIARALATNPRYLVCDEPTSALDVTVGEAILELLAELQEKSGVSYLFISHDLSVVRYFADRIAVMCKGDLVETGSPAEIFGSPREEYTASLIEASVSYSLLTAPERSGRSATAITEIRVSRSA